MAWRKAVDRAGHMDLVEFLDVVLADPDLVDAEFASIVADAWSSDPPGTSSRCAIGGIQPRRPALGVPNGGPPMRGLGVVARRLGRTRQRSPPTSASAPHHRRG